jgi:hypothetical protein
MVYLVFLYVIELHLFINISALYNLLCSTFYKDNLLVYTLCLQLSLDTYQALPNSLPGVAGGAGFQPQFHCCQMAKFWAAGPQNGPVKLLAT